MGASRVVAELRVGNMRLQAVQSGSRRELRVVRAGSGRSVGTVRISAAITSLRRGAARHSGDARRAVTAAIQLVGQLKR